MRRGNAAEDEESEDEREVSKNSASGDSSESSCLRWMPPPEIRELDNETSSVGGTGSSCSSSEHADQRRASASQGPASLHIIPSAELAESSRLQARGTSPAFVETSISAIHQAVRGCPGSGQTAEGDSSGSQPRLAAHADQCLQTTETTPFVVLEPVLADPERDDLIALYHKETGMAMSALENLYRSGALQTIPRNDEGDLSSLGSVKHADQACAPCIFWFRGMCNKSLRCTYCHFKHPGQKVKRHKPNKRTRLLLKEARSAEQATENLESDHEMT